MLMAYWFTLLTQTLPVSPAERSGFQHGTPAGLEIPQCFLSSSPENRISPHTSPIPSALINGPLSKVAHPALIEMFSLLLFCSALNVHSLFFSPRPTSSNPQFSTRRPRTESRPAMRRPSNRPAAYRITLSQRWCFLHIFAFLFTYRVDYLVVSAGNLIPQPMINSCCSNPVLFSQILKRMSDPLFFIHGLGMVTLSSSKTEKKAQ